MEEDKKVIKEEDAVPVDLPALKPDGTSESELKTN
jgi:hypothetical protein